MVGVVNVPENVFKKWRATIAPQWWVCFWAAIALGLTAHLYKITGWLPNWDSLVFRHDPQNMVVLGRWFLPVVCSFSSLYDLPFLNGLVAILFHALGAVCICRLLNVEKNGTALLIGGIVAAFPTVTSVMMYNYVADGYAVAFFLSTLAALLMTQEKPRYLIAALLITLSAGIYQAYLTVTVTLILIKIIDDTVHRDVPVGTTLKKAVPMLITGVVGMVVYAVVLKVLLKVLSMEMLEYQGLNTSGSAASFDVAASLYTIKETFFSCFFDRSNGINLYVVVNAVVLVLTLAYFLKRIIQNKIYKKPLALILIVLSPVMLILGAGLLAFINPQVDYHNLMRMGYVAFYLLFLLLYERGTEADDTHAAVQRWTVLAVAAVILVNQVVIANLSYHKAQMAYEKSYGVLIRIADRIEQTPESDTCDKILVLGALKDSKNYSVNLTPDITGITDGYILRADDEVVGQSVLCSALNDYCGTDYTFVSGAEKDAIAARDDVTQMGIWPAKDCITVIDGTLIIKLSAEGEL